jgi:hypothetical protein
MRIPITATLLVLATLISCKGKDESDTSDTSSLDGDGDGLIGEDDCDDSDEAIGGPGEWFIDADSDGFGNAAATTVTECEAPQGYVADATDCDDTLQDVHPGAEEACNNVDDDCDGTADEEVDLPTWYVDSDGDGYGDSGTMEQACEAPAGFVSDSTDCDDASPLFNPGADEADCTDPNDYNCDGSVGYADADADGFAACVDCDDTNGLANPAMAEVCNDFDDDCDGTTDAGAADAVIWYLDVDQDGYGDEAVASITDCDQPSDYVSASGDCDDTSTAFNPGASELCTDPTDYNCDGSTGYADVDADGWAACEDCDDGDPTVNPDGVESCDGVDDDCNGTIDDDYSTDASTWHVDADRDGHGDPAISTVTCDAPTGYVAASAADDCDDSDKKFYPGATETDCSDPNDYNCDGSVAYTNADGDAYAACEECNDAEADVNPGAAELCNTVDDDCDGSTDENSAIDARDWYLDGDGDGYGDPAEVFHSCTAPFGYVEDGTDCDDYDPAINPDTEWFTDTDGDGFGDPSTGAVQCEAPTDGVLDGTDCDDTTASVSPDGVETCDGVDQDCNGTVDDDYAIGAGDWFADADGDGYGDPSARALGCTDPVGFISDSSDCDDTAASVYPGAAETCNLEDDDCNGTVDDDYATDALTWYEDLDGDGHGTAASTAMACEEPSGFAATTDDCDDTRSAVSPSAAEVCDAANTDEDCDGATDNADASATGKTSFYADSDSDGYGGGAGSAMCDSTTAYPFSTATDCDDSTSSVSPAAAEICDAANVDEDCDGKSDDSDSGAAGGTSWYADSDKDGYGGSTAKVQCDASTSYPYSTSLDCNDSASAVNPGTSEICDASNVDEDCDGSADDLDSAASGKSSWYADSDSDGYGGGTSASMCDSSTAYPYSSSSDCNDAVSAINPGAAEVCDSGNTDEDCDGKADDADTGATGGTKHYADSDSDGYGGSTSSATLCDPSTAYPYTVAADCNDAASAVNPGASEVCDSSNVDEDCDGTADDADASTSTGSMTSYYLDSDTDGYGGSTTTVRCDASTGYVTSSTDCDDTDTYVYPGAKELCDGQYNDCSTSASWTADSEDGKVSSVTSAGKWTDQTSKFTGTSSSPYTYTPTTDTTTYFCDGTYYARVLTASNNVSLIGRNGSANTTLNAGGTSGVGSVVVLGSAISGASLKGLTITGGHSGTSSYGGGIYSLASSLTIDDCKVNSNFGYYGGGGLYHSYSGAYTLNISNSEFKSNSTSYSYASGVGIYAYGSSSSMGTLNITDTVIDGNSTTATTSYGNGGGLWVYYTNTTLDGVTIKNHNKTAYYGGAIYSYYGNLSLIDSSITSNNTYYSSGSYNYGYGTIYAYAPSGRSVSLSNTTITGNNAGTYGGALYISGALSVSNSTLSSNTAGSYGGAIYDSSGALTISGSTISNNTVGNSTSTGYGGAIYHSGSSSYPLSISSSTISGNTAQGVSTASSAYGGGLYVSGSTGTISGTTISSNTSYGYGGGIYQTGSTSSLTVSGSSSITSNTAGAAGTIAYGGGWMIASGSGTLSSSSITSNKAATTYASTATAQGGGVQIGSGSTSTGTFTCSSGSVTGNSTSVVLGTSRGGGAYIPTTLSTSYTSRLYSTSCDWGTSDTENSPNDVMAGTTAYTAYGSGSTFTCTVTTTGSCI